MVGLKVEEEKLLIVVVVYLFLRFGVFFRFGGFLCSGCNLFLFLFFLGLEERERRVG